jgi:hypothetical protein
MFIIRENFGFAQERSKNIYDAGPSHEFISGEGLDQVTKRRERYISLLCGERTIALPTSLVPSQRITGASCRTVRCRVEQEQRSKQCVRVP